MGNTERRQQQQQLSGILVSVFSCVWCWSIVVLWQFVHAFQCIALVFFLLYSSFVSCKQKCVILFEFQKIAAPSITLCACVNLNRCAKERMRWKNQHPPDRQRWINILKEFRSSTHTHTHRKESNEIIITTTVETAPVTKTLDKMSTVYTIFKSASKKQYCVVYSTKHLLALILL